MKTQNNQNRKRNLVVKVILGFIIGISLGFGITKVIKSDKRLTTSIEKTIQEYCDCESVHKNISAVGIQLSKENGFSNQTASFTLINCKYENSTIKEAERINEHLKTNVEDYVSVDIVELTFQSNGEEESVKIKNGTIL